MTISAIDNCVVASSAMAVMSMGVWARSSVNRQSEWKEGRSGQQVGLEKFLEIVPSKCIAER